MRSLWSLPNARNFLIGQSFSILGDSALWLAAGVWVKVLTGSNAAAGLTFFFLSVPSLASPLAGMLVDRVRRRPLLIVTNAVTGVALLPLVFVHDAGEVWVIWVVMTLYGCSNTVLGSAQSALLTVIVPDDLLAHANGVLRTVREGLRLIAPLLGVGLFTLVGGGVVAVVDMGTFAIALISLLLINTHEKTPDPSQRGHWRAEVSAGFRYVWHTAILRQITVSTGLVLLVVGLLETVVFALVSRGLHEPASFVGVVITIQGAGAILGGLTAASAMNRWNERFVVAVSMLVLAIGVGLWIVPQVAVVLAGSVIVGAALPWLVVGTSTIVQRRTPEALQGRVFSAFDTATTVPQTISIALGAALVSVIPYTTLLAVTVVVTGVSGLWLFTRRAEGAAALNAAPASRGT
ncbi:hypothetical protein AX769_17230 [Frondihabitans sp. PAMC 28766]|uniref:MFS transporter n=1 Tax=Frondihabitans sp. PAMC 28766 TaxID=1795630 RepID=UPI00078CA411|nr:MFS transporter [Frondihabitans sp. PAMC 28766]AMM21565.1 hypothetical protein AX769_17230 [Frondihabitans sp. PAMC 28766]